ncbi:MAG: Do family serine endopeptidase [Bacteroidetes bacterium]|nr:Do family serine endopeptidase [Bacteroidota bacterium]
MNALSTKSVLAAIFLITLGIIFGVVLVSSYKGIEFSFAGEDVKLGAKEAPVRPNETLYALNEAFHQVGVTVTPSVVYVEVEMDPSSTEESDISQFFYRFFGPDFKFDMPRRAPEKGAGSGVIITSNGYILTNNHVVAGAKKNGIKVQLSDTREFKAKLIGTDKYTDLAVIKIEASDLPAAALGNSDEVEVGHIVFAIGAPLGLKSTMTEGIVSALGRQIGIINDESGYGIENFIQTDAAVNPGNSGGPLVNIKGEVIGINTAIATTNARYQGYSFAIPINLAKKVATDIIKHGTVRRGYIGIRIEPVDAVTAKALGMDKPRGVKIREVNEKSAGEEAGLQAGDVILSIDGREVNSPNALQSLVASKSPGDVVTLKVWRDKKEIQVKVTLKARSEEESIRSSSNDDQRDKEEMSSSAQIESLGITIRTLDSKLKREYKVEKGVYVERVEPFSHAQERGLVKGDVILSIGDKNVGSVEEFRNELKRLKSGDAVMLRVKGSDKKIRFVAIEIP